MANTAGAAIYGFNARSEHAVRAARRYAARRITEINDETRAAIRATIIRGIREDIPPRELARIIAGRAQGSVPLIGLHSRQAMAALNYRGQLAAAGLSPAAITRAMAKYTRRKLAERTLNIARTETMTALNYGRNAVFNTAIRRGALPPGAQKEWIITPDERLCRLCAPMAGVTVGVRAKFQTARGAVPAPPLHPSCRCTVVLRPIRGGKRLSPIPQPSAAPIFPIKLPTAPKPPPSQPAPASAPVTPSSAAELPATRINKLRAEGYGAGGVPRAEGVLKMAEDIAEEHGERFVRTRGMTIGEVATFDHAINMGGGKYLSDGTYGVHAWLNRRTRLIGLKGDITQANKADVLDAAIGSGRNFIVNGSIPGSYLHEFGHAVYYQALEMQDVARVQKVYHELRKLPAPVDASEHARTALSKVSVYAEQNASEMWAEAYTLYTHPDYKPEMLGGELAPLRELLDEILNSAAGAKARTAGGKGWLNK